MLEIKRAYENPESKDGYRVLVDRLWPRGIKKEDLQLDSWEKDIAPSPDLRKEFNHDPKKFDWFKEQYRSELEESDQTPKFVKQLKKELDNKTVTLVYGAKDKKHNHAIVLKEYVESCLKEK